MRVCDGRVKVTDFGIAKAADQSHEELTRTGSVLGTARYLAPEQLEGLPIDERADVYSLGLVLYEMLSGRSPFGAETEIATAVAWLTSAPPRILDVRPEIAPGLAHVVDRALARAPDDRWQTAAAMRDALTPFRVAAPDRGADATMPVALPPRRRRSGSGSGPSGHHRRWRQCRYPHRGLGVCARDRYRRRLRGIRPCDAKGHEIAVIDPVRGRSPPHHFGDRRSTRKATRRRTARMSAW